MRAKLTLLAGVCAGAIAFPAYAQDAAEDDTDTIVVTAQRTNEKLQDVPIAVSAFSAEALEKQQIKNTSDLQLTLPNVTFTKTNFTSSSFTIRGIGDLCVGETCDQATAIHMNDAPLFGTRLFEGEFYDLAQIEVLRGPQGTLFGRNATSGVVNIRTARPSFSGLAASAEAEYGNYDSVKVKGMVNVPLGDIAAIRVAGYYLNRDGYTLNTFTNTRQDNRDMYGLRGSLRVEPSSSTTIDLMVQYFHESDNRMRAQKLMCQRDPTGILGCLNGERAYDVPNGNATLAAILTSREFLSAKLGATIGSALGLGSLYGNDYYVGESNPADPRVVHSDFTPTYFTKEWNVQGSIEQDLGGGLKFKLGGNYQKVELESQQDYNSLVVQRGGFATGLGSLSAAAAGAFNGVAPGLSNYLGPIAAALIPSGASGALCTSQPEETLTGIYGGHKICTNTPLDFDRSDQYQSSWSAEAILSSDWDGPVNFLLGGIYSKFHLTENSYYINSFGLDYATGLLGAMTAYGNKTISSGAIVAAPFPVTAGQSYFLASPFYRNNSDDLKINSYGIFGEAYWKFSDTVKLTLGLRYNHDEKDIAARTTLASFLAPTGIADANSSPYIVAYDADAGTAGNQLWQVRGVKFSEWTGRAVVDWNITPDNLLYFSYSRGYKSGGINPPLSPVFTVPDSFKPEFVNAFEIGSKNQFGNVTLNLTGFYFDYKDLQLSRIVARTSVNDNVSAKIWGLEAEAIFRPTRELTLNVNASYLHTEVSEDKMLANPRDFGGGRADAVIIKDITNASNCAVASNSGNVAGVNSFVGKTNALLNTIGLPDPQYSATTPVAGHLSPLLLNPGIGLQTTTSSFGANSGIASTGAFSVCDVLTAAAAGSFSNSSVFGALAIDPAALGGVTVYSAGIPVNIKGNKLPGAPDYKFSAGIQYAAPVGDLTVTPRLDFIYTGKSTGNIFNGVANEVPSFTQVNAQLQVDGADKKWFARVWVQNLFDKDSITGLYVTDQSSGNYTNIFTLEPRRYGLTAGIKF
ncbi:MAG: TonB-dependent receptor [Novosphingobium sp.]|uniref:TonB-dependent receptor domain-containing protein n=1 Tax=Novosphingobium sp. TaxID=1874826 RepID=UPI002611CE82|nr:TonB-dependent receptor [Novosphingobium sp.]MCP5385661.1 TonB-dependent receptor [Novosphingobium sp.]